MVQHVFSAGFTATLERNMLTPTSGYKVEETDSSRPPK